MIKLTEYIIEKLKINNSTESNIDLVNSFMSLIADIANIDLNDKDSKDIVDAIDDWVRTFDLKDQNKQLKCYFDWDLEEDEERRLKKRKLMKFVTKDNEADFLKKYDDDKAYSTNPIVKKGDSYESKEIYLYDNYLIYLRRWDYNRISNEYIFYIEENN